MNKILMQLQQYCNNFKIDSEGVLNRLGDIEEVGEMKYLVD